MELIYYATWCINFLYTAALLPQISLNHKRRSTVGISGGMMLLYFLAYCAKIVYAYNCVLPLAYRVQGPINGGLVLIMIVQRGWYSDYKNRFFWKLFYGIIFFFSSCLILSCSYSYRVGYICGWVAMISFALYQLPQLLRVYKTKSSKGVSRLFIGLLLCATTLEFFTSLFLHLPLPSCLNGLRGMITYSLLLCSCFYYSQDDSITKELHA